MQNWFNTLYEALEAEGLLEHWNGQYLSYGDTKSCTYDDGTRFGHYVSVYRDERGMYERPVHYARG